MNGGFHRRRHEQSPDQYVGLQSFNANNCCFFFEIQPFPQVLEDTLEVSKVGRLAYFGVPSLTFRFGCLHFAPVFWRGLSLMFRVNFLSRDETQL